MQGLSANTDYKVKALVGTSGISLQTTAGADFAYLGSDGNANDIFVKANGRIVIKTDPYNDKELPQAPEDLVVELSKRYVYLYETITGKTFPFPDKSLPVTERIIDNLGSVL